MAELAQVSIGVPGKMQPVVGHHYGDHSWPDRTGLSAPEVRWRLPVGTAALVLAETEVQITITPPDGMGEAKTWKRIVVVGEGAAPDPYTRVVILSDVRWYYLRINLISTYNRRVPSGQFTNTPAGGFYFYVAPLTAQITYALPTLRNDGGPSPLAWNAQQMVNDAFARAQRLTALAAPGTGGVFFRDASTLASRGQWNPQDVGVDAPGNTALGQILASVGGLDIRVAPDGFVEIVDAFLGAEKATVEAAVTYSLDRKGVMRWCAMNHVAPRSMQFAFTRELEVRCDEWEQAPPTTEALTLVDSDAPWAENVITVVDLQLPGVASPGQTPSSYIAFAGMVVPADAWFAAVAAKGDASNATAPYVKFSREIMIQTYLAKGLLDMLYVQSPVDPAQPDLLWAARIGQATKDFRSFFRLNPRFARRCVPGTIVAKRAALLNPATGERQPSPVWRDYFRLPTLRGLANQTFYGTNVASIPPLAILQNPGPSRAYADTSFPDDPFPISAAQYAPFALAVEDSTNGYFRLSPRLDPNGNEASITPSLIAQPPGLDTFKIQQGLVPPYLENCSLLSTDRVAWIFSAVPVGLNGEAQTQNYTVDAQKALARLGVQATAVTAQGPIQTIRIGDGVQRARVAWADQIRGKILAAFGVGAQGQQQFLVPANDGALNDYSISCAAVYYASVLDHYEGTLDVAFMPWIRPIGSLTAIEHTVTATGELYTSLHANFVQPTLRPEAFMSQSSRNELFGHLGASAP